MWRDCILTYVYFPFTQIKQTTLHHKFFGENTPLKQKIAHIERIIDLLKGNCLLGDTLDLFSRCWKENWVFIANIFCLIAAVALCRFRSYQTNMAVTNYAIAICLLAG